MPEGDDDEAAPFAAAELLSLLNSSCRSAIGPEHCEPKLKVPKVTLLYRTSLPSSVKVLMFAITAVDFEVVRDGNKIKVQKC